MRYLLDTHTLLWALEDSQNLTNKVREIILDDKNEIYVSAISIWEISMKHKKSPTLLPFSGNEIINYCLRAGYRFLAISIEDMMVYDRTDYKDHKDPFDKMLIAQSINGKMKIITHDIKMREINKEATIYF